MHHREGKTPMEYKIQRWTLEESSFETRSPEDVEEVEGPTNPKVVTSKKVTRSASTAKRKANSSTILLMGVHGSI